VAKILRLASILAVFCAISAGGLAFVFMLTQPMIELNAKTAFTRSLREVLPDAISFSEVKSGADRVFRGRGEKNVAGVAVALSSQGYSGPIELLVGIGANNKVKGVKVLGQRETPGLGANIIKPSFLVQFVGKDLNSPLEPKKDIDAITGATISSRAVCKGVKDSLEANDRLQRKNK
jgi:electron transport complex protein RnfG